MEEEKIKMDVVIDVSQAEDALKRISEFREDIDALKAAFGGVNKELSETDKAASEAAAGADKLAKAAEVAAASAAKAASEAKGMGTGFKSAAGKALGGLSGLAGGLGGLLGPIGEVVGMASGVGDLGKAFMASGKSVGFLSQAMKVMKVAIASTGVGLLVILVASLVAYFAGTAEGGGKLSAIFTGIGKAVSVLMKPLAKMGEKLVGMFMSPMKTMESFHNFIKDKIMGGISMLGDVIGAIFSGDFAEAANIVKRQFNAVVDSVKSVVDAVVETVGEAINAGVTAAGIEERILEFENKRLKLAEAQRVLDEGDKTRLEFERDNTTKDYQLRISKSKELVAHGQKMFDQQIAVHDAYVKQLKAKNAIGSATQEDLKKEMDAQLALNGIISERNGVMADLIKSHDELVFEAKEAKKALEQEFAGFDAALDAIRTPLKIELDKAGLSAIDAALYDIEQSNKEAVAAAYAASEGASEALYQLLAKKLISYEEFDKKLIALEEKTDGVFAALYEKRTSSIIKAKENEVKRLAAESAKAAKEQSEKDKQAAAEAMKAADENFARAEAARRTALAKDEMSQRESNARKLQNERNYLLEKIELLKKNGEDTADLEADLAEKDKEIQDEKRNSLLGKIGEEVALYGGLAVQAAQAASDIISQMAEQNIAAAETQRDGTIAALDDQLAKGLISQKAYDTAKGEAERIANDKIRKEKKKAAIAAKVAAIISAVISTALAVVGAVAAGAGTPVGYVMAAIAGAFGAIQIGLIAAQPIPEFAEGVLGLQGAGTETSDSITAKLSRGESVMTARETRDFLPTLRAIRSGAIRPEALNAAAVGGNKDMDTKVLSEGLSRVEGAIRAWEGVKVNADKDGFSTFIYHNGNRQQRLDNRYQSK